MISRVNIPKCMIFLATLLFYSSVSASNVLEDGFKHPAPEAKPQVWWHWMYGNITKDGITKDLELMQELGIGGVTQFHNAWTKNSKRRPATPRGPVRFMSHEYRELVRYALKECERLGMTMGLQICDGFSQTGGPWITPETGMRVLRCQTIPATGGKTQSLKVPEYTVAILAYPGSIKVSQELKQTPPPMIRPQQPYLNNDKGRFTERIKREDIINLTNRLKKDQTLIWDPPPGEWVIAIFHHVFHPATNHPASPEGHGLECNKLNSDYVDIVYDKVVGPLIDDAGDLAGKTLSHVLIDSWECGYQSWTPGLIEEFKQRRGYDPMPYLPSLALTPVESIEISNRFLCDFRVTLDDLMIEEYYGHIRDRLHEKGMQLHAEVLYGWAQMFGNPIRQYGVCDVPMNEVWMAKLFAAKHQNIHGRAYTGYAATSGHVYGKPIIKDEAFTVGAGKGDFHYLPSEMKSTADYVLCRGTNRFVLHTSTHQPDDRKPGWTHGWNGVNFHRGNTWWPYAGGFINYLARCSYMLQQGLFVADVCRYVGHEDTYSQGYGELPLKNLPKGYRADHCDNTVLLERMDVKNGRIVLPDSMSYAVLMLADKKTMSPDVLQKLAIMVKKGATIIGPKPEHAPGLQNYPQCDDEVKLLANTLWDKGSIRDISLDTLLQDINLEPDFSYTSQPEGSRINFIHRTLPEAEIYFMATAGEACIADCSFRVTGKQPACFNPLTGEIHDIALYHEQAGRTRIPLQFEAQGSKIIVFREKSLDAIVNVHPDSVVPHKKGKAQEICLPRSIILSGPWTVTFEPGRGALDQIQLDNLISWTEHEDFGVQHFSGVGTYSKTFTLPKQISKQGNLIYLDLGDVKDMAEVLVNGKSVAVLWRAPFRVDITSYVQVGNNELEIKIINTWVNRLIGDKKVSKQERICEIISPDPKWYTETSKLRESGLLGPVSIYASIKTKKK